jgi:hypothetical protein
MSSKKPLFKLRYMSIALCSILFAASADPQIYLGGTVRNGEGNAISQAKVCLLSDTTLRCYTDSAGKFIISNTAVFDKDLSSITLASDFRITGKKNNQFTFLLRTPVGNGNLAVFSANGKRCIFIPLGQIKPGIQNITLPGLAKGICLIKFTLDRQTFTCKLINTGNYIVLNKLAAQTKKVKPFFSVVTAETADTLLVTKEGFKPEKAPVDTYNKKDLAIIMDRTRSIAISVKDMPSIEEMPDPLIMNDGTRVTTAQQWRLRRREMIRILEDYEYGHIPPPPGNVTATVATPLTRIGTTADYRMMRLSFGPDKKLGFDLGIFTPLTPAPSGGFPVMVSLDFSAGKSSLGAASAAISRGYAVATIPYQQLGEDSRNYLNTAFFPYYPEYDWRDFSAWAWGISRAVDYLVTDSLIDKGKIIITGVSRNGQAVLLAGALDERIALSAPVAGGMALRFSGKEMGGGLGQGITEIVDQNTYWFGPLFEKFRNQTPKLPCDQHWLLALTAPRLFIMCNSLSDPYGRAYAAVQTYLGAKPVYQFLDAEENLGIHFREGGHGMNSEDWTALLDFADQKLLKKEGNRKFDVLPPAEKLP